jgi:hypothetical protein
MLKEILLLGFIILLNVVNMDISRNDLLLKHPFTCLVAGPTLIGKYFLVQRLNSYASVMFDPKPEGIVWCNGGG